MRDSWFFRLGIACTIFSLSAGLSAKPPDGGVTRRNLESQSGYSASSMGQFPNSSSGRGAASAVEGRAFNGAQNPGLLADGVGSTLVGAGRFVDRHNGFFNAGFSLFVAVFTGLLWVVSRDQYKILRGSVSAADQAAKAAKKSADVAEIALTIGERPWLFATDFVRRWHADPTHAGKYNWSFRPVWTNTGNTPARRMRINVAYRLAATDLPEDFDFPDGQRKDISLFLGPKNSMTGIAFWMSAQDLAAVKNREKYFHIWGWAKYFDPFPETPERCTRFCCFVSDMTGNPELPDPDAPGGGPCFVNFMVYHRHNSAD